MNRHLLFFAQRVASAAASSVVYILAEKYTKSKRGGGQSAFNRNRHATPRYYSSDQGRTKRPYVPREKPYKAMHEYHKK